MTKRAATALTALALLLSAACGGGVPEPARVTFGAQDAGSARAHPASFTGLLTEARRYSGQQIDLEPPPSSMHPQTSPEDAFATCRSEAPCIANQSPEIMVALYTNRAFGQMQPDGAVLYPHQNVLAYVMTWRNVPFVPAGSSLATGPATVERVDHVVFVDANSGRPLLAIDTAPSHE